MKRKILIIVENQPVPADPRVYREAVSLREAGYEVTVLCPRTTGCPRRYEQINGVHVYRHPMVEEADSALGYVWEYSVALFWQFLYTWWIFFRRGFFVIQGCNPPDDIFLVALPFKLFGVKYIFDHHDANPELYIAKYGKQGFLYKALTRLEKWTYRSADVVIATNASYAHLAVTRGQVPKNNVFIVRNGPDLERVCAFPPNPALKHGKPYLVGYVGHMSEQDGLDILLDVAALIKASGRRDVQFSCVGGGPGLAGLRKRVKEKELDDMMNFTGRVSDEELLEVLSTADVCVNPDKPCEMNDISTMIKIMEYMALSKPIVQFNVREGRFSAQDAAVYADTGNQVSDFAAKILWLLDNPEERRRMGEFGRKRIENELAWNHSVPNLLAAYSRAFGAEEIRDISSGSQSQTPDQDSDCLVQYYRCPERLVRLSRKGPLSSEAGYFQFGSNRTYYGRCAGGSPSSSPVRHLPDVLPRTELRGGAVAVPFDLKQVVDDLRCERYPQCAGQAVIEDSLLFRAYYLVRPLLPVTVRKHIQQWRLRDWKNLQFPRWPVDRSVEQMFEQILLLALRAQSVPEIPFIWFWPEGATSCAIMTHDVETLAGVQASSYLMQRERACGIKGSFQIIPEQRYEVTESFLNSIRECGFDVVVHDLNHDGKLFCNKEQFLKRVQQINAYKQRFGASGFRAAVLYRRQEWFDALDFCYDMSVPNVAHLDPQRGGCCTVMPYFVGKILELPVTTTQDYTLFNILNDYSIDLWKKQIELIMESHGLISLIVHPDYVVKPKEKAVYESLLEHLIELRDNKGVWIASPSEVDRWWRQRAEMKLTETEFGFGWCVQGPGSQRARIAYASEKNGRIQYSFTPTALELGRQAA
jgi:glycosyltransferase involved in cell wall biosynthesis